MERSTRIQQLYGYSACLVALITFVVTVSSVIDAITTRRDPLRAESFNYGVRGNEVLTSYEAYQISNPEYRLVRSGRVGPNNTVTFDTLSAEAARARYETLRTDREEQVRFNTGREILRSSVMLLLAIAIFGAHWAWLRRVMAQEAPKA